MRQPPASGPRALDLPPAERSPDAGARGLLGEDFYRHEALADCVRGSRQHGSALELSPRWLPWAFRLLILVFAGSGLFALLARVDEYARGTFVVRADGRAEVTATQAGTVSAVAVEAGQRVAAGQLLARFDSAQEGAELEHIRRELELALIQRLRAPTDAGTERVLSSLRARKELAEARLEQRSLRSPLGGMVSDLLVQPGQHVVPGDVVVSVVGERPEMSVIAMLPGHFRPLLRPGMSMRLELEGYRYTYQHLVVERVSDEVFGVVEARRFLGVGFDDALPPGGPVIFVFARLPAPTFDTDGRIFPYHEGMRGLAEVRVRSEGVLTTLFPGLKAIGGAA